MNLSVKLTNGRNKQNMILIDILKGEKQTKPHKSQTIFIKLLFAVPDNYFVVSAANFTKSFSKSALYFVLLII